jgi:hypothetical protein
MRFIFLLLNFLVCFNLKGQMDVFMKSITNKNIHFTDSLQEITADYSVDTSYFVLKHKDTLFINSLLNGIHYEYYGKHNDILGKADVTIKSKDTSLIIYEFYNHKLFEIVLKTQNDSIARVWYNTFSAQFKEKFPFDRHHADSFYFFTGHNSKKDFNYRMRYNLAGPSLFTLVISYRKIEKFLPLWCGTDKPKNWKEKMQRKMRK